ncbi:MAG: class I SAM-dependent methyltransferase [Myxococcota bacterium]|nr:class I SAM-dependent methyltransferase [Myxococcota bacterium]
MSEPSLVACMLCGHDGYEERFEKLGRRFLACRQCGLVRIEPMPSAESLEAYYQNEYGGGRYTEFAEAESMRRLIATHRIERIQGHLDDESRSGRWLDVGCTTGDFIAACVETGAKGEGVDISSEAVAQATRRGLVAHHSRIEDFSPSSPYRVITAFDVIEHLLDPRSFVRRLRSWLCDDGCLVLTTPDVSSIFPRWLMRSHWFYYWPDEHLFYFDPKTISRLLEEEGFAVAEVGRAYKPLTLDYAAGNLQSFNRGLGGLARASVSLLPKRVRTRPIRMYVGEMIVIARAVDGAPS